MNFRRRIRTEPMGFQIIPIIDVILLLLIFFVSTWTYAHWETEMNITWTKSNATDFASYMLFRSAGVGVDSTSTLLKTEKFQIRKFCYVFEMFIRREEVTVP